MRVNKSIFFWMLVMNVGFSVTSLAQDPPAVSVNRIIEDWKQRANRIQSLRLSATGEGILTRGNLNSRRAMYPSVPKGHDIPAQDHSYPVELEVSVDFEQNLFKKTDQFVTFSVRERRFFTRKVSFVFDGQRAARVTAKDKDAHWDWEELPDVEIEIVYLPKKDYVTCLLRSDYPWLFCAGVVPRPGEGVGPNALRSEPLITQNDLSVRGITQVNGRDHVVIRSTPASTVPGHFHEYYVDVERQSAISRWKRYAKDTVSEQYDMVVQNVDGMWLPRSWKWKSFGDGRLIKQHTLEVRNIEVNPVLDKDKFDVSPRPASVVGDFRKEPAGVSRVWQKNGTVQSLDDALSSSQDDKGSVTRIVILATTGVVLVMVVLVFLKRANSFGRK